MNCPNCGKPLQEGAKFCMGCGQRIPRCPTCGTVLLRRAKFCTIDGTRIPDEIIALIPEAPTAANPAPESSRPAAPMSKPVAEVPRPVVPAPKPPAKEVPLQRPLPAQQSVPVQKPPVRRDPPIVPVYDTRLVREMPKPQPQAPVRVEQETVEKKKSKLLIPIIVVALAIILLVVGLFVGKSLIQDKGIGEGMSLSGLFQKNEDPAEQPEDNESVLTDADDAEASTEANQSEESTEAEPTGAAEETEPPTETEPPKILMPDCTGMSYEEVVLAFESIPCQLSFTYDYSDNVQENYVIDQNFTEGCDLTAESEVVITVSKGPDVAPEGYNQKVTVTAAPGSSYGTLTFFEWEDGEWVSKFSCDATLGSNGISPDYGEGKKRTPEGVFKLGVAFTANSLSDSDWPVQLVSSDTCVVDDVNSEYYNTVQSIQSLPSGVSYDPIGRTITQGTSNICIYIEHNGNGYDSENVVPGKGSVITICGRNSSVKPTFGCIDISASNMKNLISMLSYEENPHIEIYTTE